MLYSSGSISPDSPVTEVDLNLGILDGNKVNQTTPSDGIAANLIYWHDILFSGANSKAVNTKGSYIVENYGTFNIAAASGSIAHGLILTPTNVNLIATGSANVASYKGSLSWMASGSAGIWIFQTGSGNVGGTWYAQV